MKFNNQCLSYHSIQSNCHIQLLVRWNEWIQMVPIMKEKSRQRVPWHEWGESPFLPASCEIWHHPSNSNHTAGSSNTRVISFHQKCFWNLNTHTGSRPWSKAFVLYVYRPRSRKIIELVASVRPSVCPFECWVQQRAIGVVVTSCNIVQYIWSH